MRQRSDRDIIHSGQRIFADVFRLMPPEASIGIVSPRPRTMPHGFLHLGGRHVVQQDGLRAALDRLCPALSSCALQLTTVWPGLRIRERACQHFAKPPPSEMWLFLIRMPSERSSRWFSPPPQRTAYLSSTRRPGIGLARVEHLGLGSGDRVHILGSGSRCRSCAASGSG